MHKFRDRNREKEIQPQMRFTSRCKSNSNLKSSFKKTSSLLTVDDRKDDQDKKRIHLKSTQSVLLNLGVLKDTYNMSGLFYNARCGKWTRKVKGLDDELGNEKIVSEPLDVLHLAQKLLVRAFYGAKKSAFPAFNAKPSDPIMSAAEKLLTGTGIIRRKRIVTHRRESSESRTGDGRK